MPAHITAAGKTLLADLTPEDFAARYPDGGVPELGLDTAAREALRRELATVRRRGFAVNRGASERGLVAVAVAIRDDEHAFAAVTVSMPSVRYHASRVPELVAALRETAAGVAADLVD
jgi:DNA-binding IclR family transcriptional regulator